MTCRRRWWLSGAMTAGLIAISLLGWLWMCDRAQQTRIKELLRFRVSLNARYGQYEYVPPRRVDVANVDVVPVLSLIIVHGFTVEDSPPWLIAWAVPYLGEHFGTRITEVSIYDERFSDTEVDLLLGFPDLREIDLSETQVTDAGVAKLAALDRLVVLDVSNTRVTGKSLQRFADCRELRELHVHDTVVDEETVRLLTERLPECEIER